MLVLLEKGAIFLGHPVASTLILQYLQVICINFSLTAILQVISISANMIAMWGKEAQLYLAINQEGKVYATVSLILFIGNSNIIFRNLLFISSYYFCCFLFLNNLLPFNKNFTIITTK